MQAPLQSLQVPMELWDSVSMDYIFGLPRDKHGNTGIWVCIDRASKWMVAVPCKESITAEQSARLFHDHVFKHFGLPKSLVSDRDPRFTSHFWKSLFRLCGTELNMSTADHPESDGQTERGNRVIEDVLRSFAHNRARTWSSLLPSVEFAYNTSVHASTGLTPFYVNYLRNPRLPSLVGLPHFSGEGLDMPARTVNSVRAFVELRQSIILQVRENIATAQAKQAVQANKKGRKNMNSFNLNDEVLLHESAVPKGVLGNPKLQRPWLGPFPIKEIVSRTTYKLDLPESWKIHPTFYVGKLKRFLPPSDPTSPTPLSAPPTEAPRRQLEPRASRNPDEARDSVAPSPRCAIEPSEGIGPTSRTSVQSSCDDNCEESSSGQGTARSCQDGLSPTHDELPSNHSSFQIRSRAASRQRLARRAPTPIAPASQSLQTDVSLAPVPHLQSEVARPASLDRADRAVAFDLRPLPRFVRERWTHSGREFLLERASSFL